MDWYLDPEHEDAPHRLRRELEDYLFRHSAPDSDVHSALLAAWELMANVIRHASGRMWVSLDWEGEQPVLEVHDLGPGFDLEQALEKEPGPEGGYGLKLVRAYGEDLRAAVKRGGRGARVSVRLPVYRKQGADQSYEPADRSQGVDLSALADQGGMVRREPFLLALGVNLAHRIALHDGPEAALRMVNEVGGQVGREIEDAYRRAHGIEGPMTPGQMAALFVELKAAIDGDFYVIEVEEDRIVLGNRACPFGESVKLAPSLCQMTSSVFGGIAARNRGGSRVVLDERIAVGDPGCRVTVHLGQAAPPAPEGSQPGGARRPGDDPDAGSEGR